MTVAVRNDQRYLLHLASGGLGHALHHLGNSIAYAGAGDRQVIPCFEAYPTFGVPFWDVFQPRSSIICEQGQASDAIEAFAETLVDASGLSLATFQRLHGPGGRSIPAIGEVPIRGLGPIWLPLSARSRQQFVVCDGIFRYGSGYRGRLEQAWFEARVRAVSGLERALGELRVCEEALQRTVRRRAQITGPYVGVHFRNTDRQSDLSAYAAATRRACAESGSPDVYWATDDAGSIAAVRALLPEVTIHSFARITGTNARSWGNLHYASDAELASAQLTRRERLHDALGDAYMLAYADRVVLNRESALSRMAEVLQRLPALRAAFMPAAGSPGSEPSTAA